jgi:hypothetical protein
LTSALDDGEWSASCHNQFTSITHLLEGWVGPKTSLDILEKRGNMNKEDLFFPKQIVKPCNQSFKQKKVAGIHQEPDSLVFLKQNLT